MPLTFRKSGGVRVPKDVFSLIARANSARDRKDWSAAASLYRDALSRRTDLVHIQMQLAHALKESGKIEEAERCYSEAAEMEPSWAEPLIHAAHLAWKSGRLSAAAHLFAKAASRDDSETEPLTALRALVAEISHLSENDIPAVLVRERFDQLRSDSPDSSSIAEVSECFVDCSSLLRLNESVKNRQESELLTRLISSEQLTRSYRWCAAAREGGWFELDSQLCRDLAAYRPTGTASSRADWLVLEVRLALNRLARPALNFSSGAQLLAVGLAGAIADDPLPIRSAQIQNGLHYVALLDDFSGLETRFAAPAAVDAKRLAIQETLRIADLVIVASSAAAREIERLADDLGCELDRSRLAMVPFDRVPFATAQSSVSAERRKSFLLVPGAIGVEGGQSTVLDSWSELLRQQGVNGEVELVLAGPLGWLSEAIVKRVQTDAVLSRTVTVIPNPDERQLAGLYAHASFVICPQLHESDGKLLAPARLFGKAVLASNLPAFEEDDAGVRAFEAGNARALATAMAELLSAPEARTELEQAAAARGVLSVDTVAELLFERIDSVLDAVDPLAAPAFPQVRPGVWHPLRLDPADDPDLNGAIFRLGSGWLPIGKDVCWTRPEGGELAFGLAGPGPWRLYLLLRGLPSARCRWTLTAEGRAPMSGELAGGTTGWAVVDSIEGSSAKPLRLFLETTDGEELIPSGESDGIRSRAGVGLAGLYLCGRNDEDAKRRLLEAVAFDDVSLLRSVPETR